MASYQANGMPRIEQLTRVMLRPMATPLPLGFLALGVGSCLLSALQLGWVPANTAHQVAAAVLTFVVLPQLLAAVFAFLARDVVMATSFGLLSGSWTSVSVLLLLGKPGATSPVMGVLAVVAGAALLVPATSAMWSKPVAAVLMSLAAARFIVTGVYELGASGSWKTATGVIGIVLVVSAFYGSLALALEDAQHRPVLPTDRRGTGAAALSGKLDLQLETLPTEAGVRQET